MRERTQRAQREYGGERRRRRSCAEVAEGIPKLFGKCLEPVFMRVAGHKWLGRRMGAGCRCFCCWRLAAKPSAGGLKSCLYCTTAVRSDGGSNSDSDSSLAASAATFNRAPCHTLQRVALCFAFKPANIRPEKGVFKICLCSPHLVLCCPLAYLIAA